MQTSGIIKLTGCRKPCYRRKYTFIGKEIPTSFEHDDFILSLWAVSNETLVETEELIYPWTSLVAEFAGTLSIFLGSSFMTLWDGLQRLAVWVQTKNLTCCCKSGTHCQKKKKFEVHNAEVGKV